MALSAGTKLGAFEIVGLLGAGGMGEVYRATDTRLARDVAVKTLPSSLSTDRERLARFEREAKLLAALNHPHIASVYSLDEHEGTRYLAMELVEGETLEEKLKRGALPVELALEYALQIAAALEAAHEKGVVHRDLKPANVMITPDGVVKVLDFGLAKAFAGNPDEASPGHSPALSLAMTQQGLILGTAGYMAPEQASGQATDQRADVWAFGVVVYEMLTGMPVFSGESVPHILAAVLQIEPDWNRLPPDLHPRIRQMLERCLDKKPRNRYHSIADARVDLEVASKDPRGKTLAVATDGTDPARSAPRPGHRLLPWAAGLVLAFVGAAAAWTLKSTDPAPIVRYVHALPDDRSILFVQVPVLGINADGQEFAYSTNDGLYLRRMDSFGDVRIAGTEGPSGSPVFSPDGQSVAFQRYAPTSRQQTVELARIPVTGGAAIPLAPVGNATVAWGIDWAADGTILYALGDSIWRVSENGGEAERIVEAQGDEMLVGPQLLPGGDAVLFTVGRAAPFDWDAAEIAVQSLVSGERRVLRAGGSSATYSPTGHLLYVTGATMFAVPFDPDTLEVTGSSAQIVSGVRREINTGIAQFVFSEDGTLAYLAGVDMDQGTTGLGIVDRAGAIRAVDLPPGDYADARVSPDGRWVAYTATYVDGTDIGLYELGGNAAQRRLTFGGQSRYPVWSADSARVAYQSTRDGSESIYWQLADGTGAAERLTTPAEGEMHVPDSFSPDGERLSFTVATETTSSIWVLDLIAMKTEPLIDRDAVISESVFSPDGTLIAYQSSQMGGMEIFIEPYPPTGAMYQLPQANANHHPAWSADGTEIFYFPNAGLFESVRISRQPVFSFGAPTSLRDSPFNTAPAVRRQFDVIPDGSGFIGASQGIAGTTEEDRQIRIVLNWFDELERLAPVR